MTPSPFVAHPYLLGVVLAAMTGGEGQAEGGRGPGFPAPLGSLTEQQA